MRKSELIHFSAKINVLSRLERLELNLCGRGFSDRVAATLFANTEMSHLRVLALGGAYRLTDEGLLSILKVASKLEELRLPQCSRIQGPALEMLPSLTPDLRFRTSHSIS